MVSMATGVVVLFLRSSPILFWGVLLVSAALLAALSVLGAIVADRAARGIRDGFAD
jgi:hypothetical protein